MYNSETLCVEESMHVKFDDKELGNETRGQDKSCADIQVTEDTPETLFNVNDYLVLIQFNVLNSFIS